MRLINYFNLRLKRYYLEEKKMHFVSNDSKVLIFFFCGGINKNYFCDPKYVFGLNRILVSATLILIELFYLTLNIYF